MSKETQKEIQLVAEYNARVAAANELLKEDLEARTYVYEAQWDIASVPNGGAVNDGYLQSIGFAPLNGKPLPPGQTFGVRMRGSGRIVKGQRLTITLDERVW